MKDPHPACDEGQGRLLMFRSGIAIAYAISALSMQAVCPVKLWLPYAWKVIIRAEASDALRMTQSDIEITMTVMKGA